jgi:uroporphyrin-III C-methyltransferase
MTTLKPPQPARPVGKVFLVGAGPGDPGLITVRGVECLRQADVVVHDRLICPALLDNAPRAQRIDVGKQPNHHSVPQAEINALLVQHARDGQMVVRLKGGDPFVFGRGGEEALALLAAGIPFEVVPGVTSAVAVPAYAGIPITQRGVACSVAIITGHRADGACGEAERWERYAHAADTLVFLMGVQSLPAITAQLAEAGLPASTPVAVIRQGTLPEQQVVVGTLADIAGRAADLRPPAVIVVGEVVRLRDQLAWFGALERMAPEAGV